MGNGWGGWKWSRRWSPDILCGAGGRLLPTRQRGQHEADYQCIFDRHPRLPWVRLQLRSHTKTLFDWRKFPPLCWVKAHGNRRSKDHSVNARPNVSQYPGEVRSIPTRQWRRLQGR